MGKKSKPTAKKESERREEGGGNNSKTSQIARSVLRVQGCSGCEKRATSVFPATDVKADTGKYCAPCWYEYGRSSTPELKWPDVLNVTEASMALGATIWTDPGAHQPLIFGNEGAVVSVLLARKRPTDQLDVAFAVRLCGILTILPNVAKTQLRCWFPGEEGHTMCLMPIISPTPKFGRATMCRGFVRTRGGSEGGWTSSDDIHEGLMKLCPHPSHVGSDSTRRLTRWNLDTTDLTLALFRHDFRSLMSLMASESKTCNLNLANSVFFVGCIYGDSWLLQKSRKMNPEAGRGSVSSDLFMTNALEAAVENEHLKLAEQLVRSGSDILPAFLGVAAAGGHLELLRLALETHEKRCGADGKKNIVNDISRCDNSPLRMGIFFRDKGSWNAKQLDAWTSCIELLLEAGADADHDSSWQGGTMLDAIDESLEKHVKDDDQHEVTALERVREVVARFSKTKDSKKTKKKRK